MNRDEAIDKVQKLWTLADHPNTPPHERELAIENARKFMAKFQIDEIVLAAAKPTAEAVLMKYIRVTEDGKPTMVKDQRIALIHQIAVNNRCRAVITDRADTTDVDTGRRIPGGVFLVVVGFPSDIAMVEALFSSIGWAMLEALVAEEVQTRNYQENFATGFVDRIRVRLAEISRSVETMADEMGGSTALVLRDRSAAVEDEFSRMFPNLNSYKTSAKYKFDPNAHERGSRKANTVDIGANKIGDGERKGLGS